MVTIQFCMILDTLYCIDILLNKPNEIIGCFIYIVFIIYISKLKLYLH